jgi:hypothetical protein
MKDKKMFRIDVNPLVIGFVALGTSLAVALSASGASPPAGLVRTDVRIEAKDVRGTASPAASSHPLTLQSLAPAHAVEVHPFAATPDTEDTYSLRVESTARTDVRIEAKDVRGTASPAASSHPLTLQSLAPAHAVEVHPFAATPDNEDTYSLRVESK